jgi:hypothetical protein
MSSMEVTCMTLRFFISWLIKALMTYSQFFMISAMVMLILIYWKRSASSLIFWMR